MNHATQPTIQTDSGASIRGDVTIENGNLIGRDQYNIYVGTPEQASRSQDQQAVQRALYEGTFTRLAFEPETVLIPAGEFLMGSNHGEPTERPSHPVALPDFRMGKYPVTNREYEAFTQSTGRIVPPELGWAGQIPPSVQYNHPVMGITFQEAVAYAAWLSQESGRSYCVPAEAHWERVARGPDSGCRYPWGDEWQAERCNHNGNQTTAVDKFGPQNQWGCHDLVGNVREWTCSLWGERLRMADERYRYPWQDDARNDLDANDQIRRIWRGGGYADPRNLLRCAARGNQLPTSRGLPHKRLGFRVMMEMT